MPAGHPLVLTACAALVITGCGEPDRPPAARPDGPSLRLSSEGIHVQAEASGAPAAPQDQPALPVTEGGVVRALADRPVRAMEARIDPAGDGDRRELTARGAGRRWTLVLPRSLPARGRLVVSMDLPDGGDAVVGAAVRRRPSVRARRCPRPLRDGVAPARTIATAPLVGLSLPAAERRAATVGCTVRVVERDGEPLPATRDLRTDRINVAVRDGRVTRVLSVA